MALMASAAVVEQTGANGTGAAQSLPELGDVTKRRPATLKAAMRLN
jgi:hypothetical protein